MGVTADLCKDCHRAIHRFVSSEKELGRKFHSLKKLRQPEGLAQFTRWVRNRR